jgi:hypothetical protein
LAEGIEQLPAAAADPRWLAPIAVVAVVSML